MNVFTSLVEGAGKVRESQINIGNSLINKGFDVSSPKIFEDWAQIIDDTEVFTPGSSIPLERAELVYPPSEIIGTVNTGSPYYSVRDIAVDSDCIWVISGANIKNNLSKVDKVTLNLIESFTIDIGVPISIAVSSTDIYVIDSTSKLRRINKATKEVISEVSTPTSNANGRVRVFGSQVIVTRAGTSSASNTVMRYSLDLATFSGQFLTGSQFMDSDGTYLWVSGTSVIAKYDLATLGPAIDTRALASVTALTWDSYQSRLLVGRSASPYFYVYAGGGTTGGSYTTGLPAVVVRSLLPTASGTILAVHSNATNPISFIAPDFSTYQYATPMSSMANATLAFTALGSTSTDAIVFLNSTTINYYTAAMFDVTTKTATIRKQLFLLSNVNSYVNKETQIWWSWVGNIITVRDISGDTVNVTNTFEIDSMIYSACPLGNDKFVVSKYPSRSVIYIYDLATGLSTGQTYTIDPAYYDTSNGISVSAFGESSQPNQCVYGWWSNGYLYGAHISSSGTLIGSIQKSSSQNGTDKIFANDNFVVGTTSSVCMILDFRSNTSWIVSGSINGVDCWGNILLYGNAAGSPYSIVVYDLSQSKTVEIVPAPTPVGLLDLDTVFVSSTLSGMKGDLVIYRLSSGGQTPTLALGGKKFVAIAIGESSILKADYGHILLK